MKNKGRLDTMLRLEFFIDALWVLSCERDMLFEVAAYCFRMSEGVDQGIH